MKAPRLTTVKKALQSLRASKAKYVSLDDLARFLGVYPDVLGEELAYFAPSILLDPSFNVRSIEPYLSAFASEHSSARRIKPASQREVDAYDSVAAFVYGKMTNAGGLVDPSLRLDDHDLRLLAKVVKKERALLKKKSK